MVTPTGPVIPYTLVDKLKYGDSLPWPTTPDGGGPSLQRVQVVNYGNDPANWKAGPFNGRLSFIVVLSVRVGKHPSRLAKSALHIRSRSGDLVFEPITSQHC